MQIGDEFVDPDSGERCLVVWTGGRQSPPLCDPKGYAQSGEKKAPVLPASAVTVRQYRAPVMTPSGQAFT